MKTCIKCMAEKDESHFSMRKGGTANVCRACNNAYHRQYNKSYEYRKAHSKEWMRKANRKRRMEILEHYGTICAACGERDEAVLSVDHINNDGAAHRREIANADKTRGPGGSRIYCWLKRNKFPPGFQILCQNCNVAKHKNGGVIPNSRIRPGGKIWWERQHAVPCGEAPCAHSGND